MFTSTYAYFNYVNINILQLSYICLIDIVLIFGLGVTAYFGFVCGNTRERVAYLVFFFIFSSAIGFMAGLDVYMFFLLASGFMGALLIFLVLLNPRNSEINGGKQKHFFYSYLGLLYIVYFSTAITSFSMYPGAHSNLYLYSLDNSAHDLAPVFIYFV